MVSIFHLHMTIIHNFSKELYVNISHIRDNLHYQLPEQQTDLEARQVLAEIKHGRDTEKADRCKSKYSTCQHQLSP